MTAAHVMAQLARQGVFDASFSTKYGTSTYAALAMLVGENLDPIGSVERTCVPTPPLQRTLPSPCQC